MKRNVFKRTTAEDFANPQGGTVLRQVGAGVFADRAGREYHLVSPRTGAPLELKPKRQEKAS